MCCCYQIDNINAERNGLHHFCKSDRDRKLGALLMLFNDEVPAHKHLFYKKLAGPVRVLVFYDYFLKYKDIYIFIDLTHISGPGR